MDVDIADSHKPKVWFQDQQQQQDKARLTTMATKFDTYDRNVGGYYSGDYDNDDWDEFPSRYYQLLTSKIDELVKVWEAGEDELVVMLANDADVAIRFGKQEAMLHDYSQHNDRVLAALMSIAFNCCQQVKTEMDLI